MRWPKIESEVLSQVTSGVSDFAATLRSSTTACGAAAETAERQSRENSESRIAGTQVLMGEGAKR